MDLSRMNHLTKLASPPKQAVKTGMPEEWDQYSRQWNLELPSDYTAFVKTYGAGSFFEEIWVITPFEKKDLVKSHIDLFGNTTEIKVIESQRRWPLWPSQGGMLYFGGDTFGNSFFWKTEGTPDHWTVTLFSGGYFEEEHFECGLVEFLIRWLEGAFHSSILLPAAVYAEKKKGNCFVSRLR